MSERQSPNLGGVLMSRMVVGLTILTMAALPASVCAFGWRRPNGGCHPAPATVAYSPAVYCVPVYAAAVTVPTMPALESWRAGAGSPLAPSHASNAGAAAEYSLGSGVSESRKTPSIAEAHSYFNAYTVAASDTVRSAGDRCRVGFWNLTDRAITVKAGDRSHLVQRNSQTAPIGLDRQFAWPSTNASRSRANSGRRSRAW